jgi:hypothetical protein
MGMMGWSGDCDQVAMRRSAAFQKVMATGGALAKAKQFGAWHFDGFCCLYFFELDDGMSRAAGVIQDAVWN